ncbi:Signal transduction histidine kinase [Lutibacter oricola]|uniref:histidine kinase n=1 Tax=Lutibacter oricola TaxID=762486 RepID=A0A1H3D270_9FLAO|nr:tetratricopeptide repeat-containing sensor histidine kinase [Lutibacter oricola]SDX60465.1 Signal transduction histidine kinase [Lutibacter oricola]
MRSPLRQIALFNSLLLLLCFVELNAQDQKKIDSIKSYNLSESNQKILVSNYNKLSYLYGAINLDSSLFYSNKAMTVAKKINFNKGLAVSYSYIARGMIEKGNIKSSLENFDKAIELFKEQQDSINILDSYRGMSYVASYSSSQLSSLDYNLKALNYAEALKDTISMSIIYNNLGSIYKKLDNYKLSLLYFTKSLNIELSTSSSLPEDLAVSYSNIGVLKVENNRVDEAKDDYKNLVEIIPNVKSIYLKAYLHLSLASYNNGTKNFKLAKKYIDSATVICEANDFKPIKSRAYRKKAEWFYYQNKYKESIKQFDKCIDYSKSIGVYEEFPEIYKKQSIAYSKLGLFKKSLESLQKSNTAIDSLKNNSVANLLIDFEDQKRKTELEKLKFEQQLKEHQLENETIKKKILLGRSAVTILILLIIIGIVLYYFFKVRKKNNILKNQHKLIKEQKALLESNIESLELNEKKLKKLNATKDKLFSIIGHDLKSPFNAILGFSNLLVEDYKILNDNQRLNMLNHIEKSTKSTLNLLDNLLDWARSQRGVIQLNKENTNLKELLDSGINPYLSSATIKQITVINNVNPETSVFVDSETIKVVFSNLISNAIKFSHKNSEVVVTSKVKGNLVEICFKDVGIGMDKTIIDGLFKVETSVKRDGTLNERGTGLGLILCEEFIKKNNGNIKVESKENEGSKFCVSLPTQ